ncbi:MAG: hypothetical protein E7466_02350 [Ruminococcaceae bacterium]|nr:hypothetical protein [Oscillospiraceae bacterium]MBQ3215511.1 hypothetical protein [Oscillospiraceae bacterium]
MKKRVIFIVLAVLLLSGFFRPKTAHQQRVLSRIVVIRQEHQTIYTDPSKMSQIMNALRQPMQLTLAEMDPDTLSASTCQIILERTDGSRRVYHIRGERYIRRDEGAWKQAPPQALEPLISLLSQLPPDG